MKKNKIDRCECLGADVSYITQGLSTWNEYYPCGFMVRYPMQISTSFHQDLDSGTTNDKNRKLARKLHIKYHRQYKL